MAKKDFDRLLANDFAAVEERLMGVEFADRMLRKMKNAYQTSLREGTEWFFDEIELPLGEKERAAMKARNSPAHGGGRGSSEEIDELIRHTAAYRTVFARTILKILGYAGRYIDRRTEGFPDRSIDDPAGG